MAKNELKNFPLVLLILDGFGIAPPSRGNAVSSADMPVYKMLIKRYEMFAVAAAGEAVGLPWGEAGNSEVGHLNLGAGRIVYQPVLRINKSIEQGTFFKNDVLNAAIEHCKKHNSSLHLMGLLSEGGVHSHQDHLYALLECATRAGLKNVWIHAFLDGRDSAYNSGLGYIKQLERILERIKTGAIASVCGRFYAMDRDNNWDRIEKAYNAIAKQRSPQHYASAHEAVEFSYQNDVYDEEFVPAIIEHEHSSKVEPGDSVIFFNFRPDRARQLTKAFSLPTFTYFKRTAVTNLEFVTLTEYDPDLPVRVAFPKELVENPVSRVWSDAGLKQLHIAETEKYAHVTYFFNGGRDVVFTGQTNKIIPSAGVSSYADKVEMSTPQIEHEVVEALKRRLYHCYVVNIANPDMVGHTGNLRATQRGLSYADHAIKSIAQEVLNQQGVVVLTADHGNAEEMVNWENGTIIKEHSANPVPCVLIGEQFKLKQPRADDFSPADLKVVGVLSDVTPTALQSCGISIPKGMTSRSLI